MNTLMVHESADLERCESIIEKGMQTFVEVGQALALIRDKRLYRDTHKTFAAYVKERWGKSRDWADVTITSSQTAARIADNCRQTPATESQARALSKAPPEQQAEVWQEVVEQHGDAITADKVAKVVERKTKPVTPVERSVETQVEKPLSKEECSQLLRLWPSFAFDTDDQDDDLRLCMMIAGPDVTAMVTARANDREDTGCEWGVHPMLLGFAEIIHDHSPELFEAIRSGRLTLQQALARFYFLTRFERGGCV